MFRRTGWGFTITALIVAGAIYAITQLPFQFGIDLRGGTELTYEIDLTKVEFDISEGGVAEAVKDMIGARLDRYGLKELSIAVVGGERLVIQIPGASDSQDVDNIKQLIESTGRLDFMIVEDGTQGQIGQIQSAVRQYNNNLLAWKQTREADPTALQPEKPAEFIRRERALDDYRVAVVDYDRKRKELEGAERDALEPPKPPDHIVLPRAERKTLQSGATRFENELGSYTVLRFGVEGETRVSGSELKYARTGRDEIGRPAIDFGFNPGGARQFSELTGANKDKALAIVLDDRILQAPNIEGQIGASGQITGQFSYDDVQNAVNVLRGGSLPAKPNLISESRVGAAFGAEAIQNGVTAIAFALIAILVFMLVYYMVGGFVANIALVLNIILILAYVLTFRQTLTFPGIAGVLLTIGMAVDANILIFERVREEILKGKSLSAALGAGYQRAFWVIFDSNLTTLITGMVLFRFGSGPVKGFAVTLIAGIIASFFTSVFVTRLVLSFLINRGLIKDRFPMLRMIGVPRVNFQSYCKPFLAVSAVVILATWGAFVLPRGQDNYGIDFTGGSKVTLKITTEIPKADLDALIDTHLKNGPPEYRRLFSDVKIQTISATGGKARQFTILARPEGSEPDAPRDGAATPDTAAATNLTARQAIERVFAEKKPGLLLPEPFPKVEGKDNPRWVQAAAAGGGAVAEDAQGLEAEINLLYVLPQLTDEAMGELLDRHLDAKFPADVVPEGEEASAQAAFTGLDVVELKKVTEEALPAGATISRYSIKTSGYSQPDQALRGISRAPSRIDVVDAIKAFFRGNSQVLRERYPGHQGQILELSEPFPEDVFIGPKVAKDLVQQAIIAVFIAIVAIVFYLSLRFELAFGLAAICALVHDVLLAIGIMALTDALFGDLFSIKINLPEVAAILTIIGYSVNDTIVVFDRIRENLRAGKKKIPFEDLVNASINQTLARTIWTSLTTLVVVLSLLAFGGESIKGFTFAFAIGLVTGTYSSVFVASPALIFLRRKSLERQERLKEAAAHA